MNFVEDVLERFPASREALVAIDAGGGRRVWHFGELIARSAGLSGALAARGVRRGDAVATLIGNRIEWVLAMLACMRMGAVVLPCSTQLRRKDLGVRFGEANPKLVIGEDAPLAELPGGAEAMTMAELAAVLDEDRQQAPPVEPAQLGAGDPALIVFTSGTTGEPRGALHSQRYFGGQAAQAKHWLGARRGELVWCTAASGWSKSARNVFVAPWLTEARALLVDERFDPQTRLEIARREVVNVLCQAPTEYRILAGRTELAPLPAMRRLVSAGEPLNPEVIEAFRAGLGLPIHDGYGQTETGHLSGAGADAEIRLGSMGRPLPGIETRIVAPAGDAGEPSGREGAPSGELQVRAASCPTFFSGYLGSEPFAGEWWPTGDLVSEDEDGYLWYEGRDDDIIVSAGYRIGPFEVESALVEHPAVAEAAAVPAPDAERGSVVRAIVVLASGEGSPELARELQEHVKQTTAPYKYPRIVEFAAELPKTDSGKIKRAALR
ncbi:MAG: acetyl-CoA synthetase [Solirubrobacterales bacterium]|nr:acetyl-CoA synthetase [Solirubrobacterales bacterium]